MAPIKVKKETFFFWHQQFSMRQHSSIGEFVWLSKAILPFRKVNKQTFTNDRFEVYDTPWTNHATYSLIDASKEPVIWKIYEYEWVKYGDQSCEITKLEWNCSSFSFISLKHF